VSRVATEVLSRFGLVFLLAGLVLGFSLALPSTFPTLFNWQTIFQSQSVILLLALGVSIAFSAGAFDLSIAAWLGLSENMVTGLQTNQHLSWELAIVVVLAVGVGIGIGNGLIVTRLKVDSFIATLGTSSIIAGIELWYTGGQESLETWPQGFLNLSTIGPLHIPWPFWFALFMCVVVWIMLEYLPIGRRFYVLGSNPRAAELAGISRNIYLPIAFAMGSTMAGLAGILLASENRVGVPGVGPPYLLPAFTAAILGTAAIRPGRVNPWGTLVSVLVLAVGITGLLQLGVRSFVQDVFNGVMLLGALAIVGYAQRHRSFISAAAETEGGEVASSPASAADVATPTGSQS
jgi:ribose transport system permease protein